MKRIGTLLLGLFLGLCFAPRSGATVYHSDGSSTSVQYLHDNSAQDGDTITLPAGTFDWTSDVRITKNITLQGQTTIGGTPQNPAINDATVILDDTPRSGAEAMIINVNVSRGARITGITFAPGSATGGVMAAVHLRGGTATAPATQMRIDHCHFAQIYSNPIWILGWTYGVADHNVVNCRSGKLSFQFQEDAYAGGSNGEGAWADYPYYGTDKFFFVEDNTLLAQGTNQVTGGFDCWKGGKYVARHNYFLNASPNSHGTEGNAPRGGRAAEVYDNTFNWTFAQSSRELRSGGIIYHDNTWIGQGSPDGAHMRFGIFRLVGAVGNDLTFWGLARGQNPWDVNDPHGLYQTGTTTGGSVGTFTGTVSDSSKNWTVNQWVGYSVTNTNPNSACFNHGSYIISNTATTITYHYYNGGDRGASLVFNVGDTFSIYRVFTALDQPGRGKGDLVTYDATNHPLNATCGCRTWPHQQLEPCFSWNNLVTSTNTALGVSAGGQPTEIEGRDFYNLGTGLPPDSTPQLMATIYTAAVNGVDYTGPYVYPHPLVSAASGTARAAVADFNNDGHPDYLLYNAGTRRTVVWYMNNNIHFASNHGPTLPSGWTVVGVADFNGDGHPDYLLFNATTRKTVIWYLVGATFLASNHGPQLVSGWQVVGTGDFHGDGKADLVLYRSSTRETVIWYLNNNVRVGSAAAPTLVSGWSLVAVADFNGDGHPDYLLFKPSTGQSVIWYLSGVTRTGSRSGPTIPAGYEIVGAADFDGNGRPDYVLYNAGTRQTAIWYLNNNVFVSSADGLTFPAAWSWTAP